LCCGYFNLHFSYIGCIATGVGNIYALRWLDIFSLAHCCGWFIYWYIVLSSDCMMLSLFEFLNIMVMLVSVFPIFLSMARCLPLFISLWLTSFFTLSAFPFKLLNKSQLDNEILIICSPSTKNLVNQLSIICAWCFYTSSATISSCDTNVNEVEDDMGTSVGATNPLINDCIEQFAPCTLYS